MEDEPVSEHLIAVERKPSVVQNVASMAAELETLRAENERLKQIAAAAAAGAASRAAASPAASLVKQPSSSLMNRLMSFKGGTPTAEVVEAKASTRWAKASSSALAAKLLTKSKTASVATHTWRCKKHLSFLHDIFISYRVYSEGKFARALADALTSAVDASGAHPTVFLDQFCLNDGEDWEMGFLNGLGGSSVVILLISETSLEGIKANAATRQDNVLLEYESGLDRAAKGKCRILPAFVATGSYVEVPGVDDAPPTQKFVSSFRFPRVDDFPDAPHACVKSTGATVRETMARVFKMQGLSIDAEAPAMAVPLILSFLAEFDTVVHPGTLIMEGIARTRPGGRVLVRPGTYKENIDLEAERSVHLFGQQQVVIEGLVTSRAAANASLDGFLLRALHVRNGRLAVNACNFTSSDATTAAAVVARAAAPTFTRCVWDSCAGGAIRADLGGVTEASAAGGVRATLRIEDCEVRACGGAAAVIIRAGVEDRHTSAEVINTNVSACSGTGLLAEVAGVDATLTLTGVTVSGPSGAGVVVAAGGEWAHVALSNCTVRGAGLDGVTVSFTAQGGHLAVSESMITGCPAACGLRVQGDCSDVLVTNCVFKDIGDGSVGGSFAATAADKAGAVGPGGRALGPRRRSVMGAESLLERPSTAETLRVSGLDLQGCRSCAVSGCTVSNCLTGVYFENVEEGEVNTCRIFDCQLGIAAANYFGLAITDNTIRRCSAAAVSLAAGMDTPAALTGNKIIKNDGVGVLAWRGASTEGVSLSANEFADNAAGNTAFLDPVFVPLTGSFAWALSIAPAGGRVILAAGVFRGQALNLHGAKPLIVCARQPGETTVEGGGSGGAPCVLSSSTGVGLLTGLVLRAGPGAPAVHVTGGDLRLADCVVSGVLAGGAASAAAHPPAGLLVSAGAVSATNCCFADCDTGVRVAPGAGVALDGCTLTNCRLGLEVEGPGPEVTATCCRLVHNRTAVEVHLTPPNGYAESLHASRPAVVRESHSEVTTPRSTGAASSSHLSPLSPLGPESGSGDETDADGRRCALDGCTTDQLIVVGRGAHLILRGCSVTLGGLDASGGGRVTAEATAFTSCTVHARGVGTRCVLDGCELSPGEAATSHHAHKSAAALRVSGCLIEGGATAEVTRCRVSGYANGVTVTDSGSACRLEGVAVTGCDVSGVNAIKRARVSLTGCTITGAAVDGLLVSNDASAVVVRSKITACIRCAVCVMPGCTLEATDSDFAESANGVHVGGRLSRWFAGSGGCLGNLLLASGWGDAFRGLPGLCCLWRDELTAARAALTGCRLTANGGVGLHAWMPRDGAVEMLSCVVEGNARGVVLSGPRGYAGALGFSGLATRMLAANRFTKNGDGGLSIFAMRYSKAKDASEVPVSLAEIGVWEYLGGAVASGWQFFLGVAPSGRHEDNRVFTTAPLPLRESPVSADVPRTP